MSDDGYDLKLDVDHKTLAERVAETVSLIAQYGQIEGDHHRAWTIDQITRKLLGEEYEPFVEWYEDGDDYEWEKGIAP